MDSPCGNATPSSEQHQGTHIAVSVDAEGGSSADPAPSPRSNTVAVIQPNHESQGPTSGEISVAGAAAATSEVERVPGELAFVVAFSPGSNGNAAMQGQDSIPRNANAAAASAVNQSMSNPTVQHVRRAIKETRIASAVGACMSLLFAVSAIVVIWTDIGIAMRDGSQSSDDDQARMFGLRCDSRLISWVIMFGTANLVLAPLRYRVYKMCNTPEMRSPNPSLDTVVAFQQAMNARSYGFLKMLRIFLMVWQFLGVIWFYRDEPCDAKGVYYYVFAIVIRFWVIFALAVLQSLVFLFITMFVHRHPDHPLSQRLRGLAGAQSGQGSSRPGMSNRELRRLSTRKFKQESSGIAKEDAVCAVCLSDYTEGESLKYLPCKHHFHDECISRWLATKSSCPLCNRDVRNTSTESETRTSSGVDSGSADVAGEGSSSMTTTSSAAVAAAPMRVPDHVAVEIPGSPQQ